MSDLHRRLAAISEEIRNYPTPIARCDLQLTALLDERTAVIEEINARLRQVARPGAPCPPDNTWINDGGFNAA